MPESNTYTSHGFLNSEGGEYTDVLNKDKFVSELATPFLAYTDNNLSCRVLATIIIVKLDIATVEMRIKKQIETSAGVWADTPIGGARSSRSKFANASGVEVTRGEAINTVIDEETGEITETLNAGYSNEFDGVFIKSFFKGPGIISNYVHLVLANIAQVELPA